MQAITYERLNAALDGRPVWNLGQLHAVEKRALDQAVRAGRLAKGRAHWMFISPLRTVWYRPDRPPQEIIAQELHAQRKAEG